MKVSAAPEGPVGTYVFDVEQRWCTEERLFGGAAFGAIIAAIEAEGNRPTIAASVQFARTGLIGDPLRIGVETVVAGNTVTQCRATAVQPQGIVAHAMAALAPPGRGRVDGSQWPTRSAPNVAPPERCAPREYQNPLAGSISDTLDVRVADVRSTTAVLWARRVGGPDEPMSASVLALLADHVPYGVRLVQGPDLYGVSLDATLRLMPASHDSGTPSSSWVLLEITYDRLDEIGHGTVWLSTPDGRPLAVSTQTIRVRHW
jgi:acyl-CoA thioesterase